MDWLLKQLCDNYHRYLQVVSLHGCPHSLLKRQHWVSYEHVAVIHKTPQIFQVSIFPVKIDEIQLQTININKHINFLKSNRTQFKDICHRKINSILFPIIKKIISVTQSMVRKVIIWTPNSIRKALECTFSLLHL